MDKTNITTRVRSADRWPDLPPEKLRPEIILASYFVYRPKYSPRVRIPGLNIYKEAAAESGFRDPLYFSRVYRKHFGHPPSEARQHAALADSAQPDTSLPVSRHLMAPGVDMRTFQP